LTSRSQSPLCRNWARATVGAEVAGDVVVGERGTLVGATGRIADLGCDVTNDEHHLMPHPLQPAQNEHRHRVAEVDLGAGRVDPEFRDERP
jgi:hypothetical protein